MDKKLITLRIKELIVLTFFLISKALSYLLPKIDVWLISERGFEARDNAFFLFEYLQRNHPEINAKYIISFDNKDVMRFNDKTKLVKFGSFKHYLYLCRSPYLISTHIMGFTPWKEFFITLDKKFNVFAKQKKIFLQHGITKDYLPALKNGNVHLDLFCCGARNEYEYVKEIFDYPEHVVQYTGFCRYDNLLNARTKRQILVMPTWRMYIGKNDFVETEYYKQWSSFLTSKELGNILTSNNYQLVFYPHFEVQKHIKDFLNLDLADNVDIADFGYDVQTLLKESLLLITDYSSVYFDFAYMKKPVVLFQFDEIEFRTHHYQKGYFDEKSIGVKVYDKESLFAEIKNQIIIGMRQYDAHENFVKSFFEKKDKKNCERTFASIKNL